MNYLTEMPQVFKVSKINLYPVLKANKLLERNYGMQQVRGFIDIVKRISDAIKYNKLDVSQLNTQDITDYLEELYVVVSMDEILYTNVLSNILSSAVQKRDIAAVVEILGAVVNECELLDAIYDLKIKELELDIYKNAAFAVNAHKINLNRLEEYHKNHEHGRSDFSGRGVVFSAVTGKYDDVREMEARREDLDYVLFTDDQRIKSDFWDVRYIDNNMDLDSIRLARRIKILGPYELLDHYDYSIWIDGKIDIYGDVEQYIQDYSTGEPLLCFPHYRNLSVYEEAKVCILLNKDNAQVIKAQMNKYKAEKYVNDSRMIDSCVLVRDHHNLTLRRVMETWWDEVLQNSYRDQLSFGYSCWKNDFVYDTSPMLSYKNDFFRAYSHNNVAI